MTSNQINVQLSKE